MALSPWHVSPRLSFDDVAALLAGFDISLAKTENVHDHEIKEYEEWCRVIIHAAKDGELAPIQVEIYTEDAVPDPQIEGNLVLGFDWVPCIDEKWRCFPDQAIRMNLERGEVYRWLKSKGAADEDIPEALRMMPKAESQEIKQPEADGKKKTHLESSQDGLGEAQIFAKHESDGLRLVADVIREFWSTYDPDEPATAPSSAEVKNHLIEQGASARLAEAVDRVCRPSGLQKAGLKQYRGAGR
ncbi:hypothetical protein HNO52_17455 [Billgrantia diversa]|uniref:hypothetical protein n=1 Tax=Halomonas sp. MCCC 1A13316 TaxID=2733487 RepID=UPI0018A34179|nr:hypothetical protein [Halomonas sp. MCCC 1A13316]QOR40105.1 hypothetical protein HNO52_17455 [Halomonas sp. MCCC 1A13316]